MAGRVGASSPGGPRPGIAAGATVAWRPAWSREAALRAVRATIVMPALFAITFEGLGNLQIALFAAFGTFATLVFVVFAGTARDKLRAHAGLAVAGSVLILIGTAVSSSPALAVVVTVPVAFAVFFTGVVSPNAATAVNGALLAYVLPAASPGAMSMIPDRLTGWWLASVVGTVAVLTLPAPSAGDTVRSAVARLGGALADLLEAALRGKTTAEALAEALEARRALLAAFGAAPFRPTGLAVRDQALANAVELLEWCTALVADAVGEQPDLVRAPTAQRELLAASAVTLRDSGDAFGGRPVEPDLTALDARRRTGMDLGGPGWTKPPATHADPRIAFHANTIANAALAIGAAAWLASGRAGPGELEVARRQWFDAGSVSGSGHLAGLGRYSRVAARQASLRSVWFVNSARGSLALSAAVAAADATGVQHGFWVVLGTLSVLRSNAAATGATALRALAGTVIGFGVGAVLLQAIGTSSAALWMALPVAVLVAAYAPGTAPFTVGQAAFTVTVAVLFNLLVPVGWKVGELRVEDVAIGCLVSVIVGAVFWPRGVAPVVGDDLADAYEAGAAYLREAIDWVCGRAGELPPGAGRALAADQRLEEAVRGLLAEQGTKHLRREELWRLIGGTLRLRLTAHAISRLPRACAANRRSIRSIEAQTDQLTAWYQRFAEYLDRPGRTLGTLAPPDLRAAGARAASSAELWLQEHLDHLAEHLAELIGPATHLAEIRRRPWWR